MTMYFATLTFQASFGPISDVFVNPGPNKSVGDEFLSGVDAWVREIVKGIEHSATNLAGM